MIKSVVDRTGAAVVSAVWFFVVGVSSSFAEVPGHGVHAHLVDSISSEIIATNLPPLKLDKAGPVWAVAGRTQVMERAESLNVRLDSTMALARDADAEIGSLSALSADPGASATDVIFAGRKLSQLEPLLTGRSVVRVRSPVIEVDRAITLRSHDLILDLGHTRLKPSRAFRSGIESGHSSPVIQVEGADHVRIEGGVFDGIEAVSLVSSQLVDLIGMEVRGSPGYGVIVGPGSQKVHISGSHFTGGVASGVAVLQSAKFVLIDNNVMQAGKGGSNQHAGVLVTDRRKYSNIGGPNFLLSPMKLSDGSVVYHFAPEDPIPLRATPPRNVYLIRNLISDNLANGIYVDGAINTYIKGNAIKGNSKEGICLDNGATANVIVENEIVGNGHRWGKTDLDLRLDFVAGFGRMEDGSSRAKLPGISIDNAIYNIIMNNHIFGNSGSGVKFVRTGFYNVVGQNVIFGNNAGVNEKFFFFGVEVGGAPGDAPSSDLNFESSMGNIIFRNMVIGRHYAGLQFCPNCGLNDVFDNIIMQPTQWAIEQTSPNGKNIFNNNFSLAPSRNANLNGDFGRVLVGGEGRRD